MNAFPIRNDEDLDRALELVDDLWNAERGTDEAQLFDVMSVLIEAYERENYPSPPSNPVDIVQFKLRELGWKSDDLAAHCELTATTIERLMNRQLLVTWEHATELAKGLGVRATVLGYDIRTENVGVRARDWTQSTLVNHPTSFTVKETEIRDDSSRQGKSSTSNVIQGNFYNVAPPNYFYDKPEERAEIMSEIPA